MKVISPRYVIITNINSKHILRSIEQYGRTCYKTEEKINDLTYIDFIKKIIKNGHLSVIEHFSISVLFICDRGVSHELVRHRLAAFSQESTRYVNYMSERFDYNLCFIKPAFWKT